MYVGFTFIVRLTIPGQQERRNNSLSPELVLGMMNDFDAFKQPQCTCLILRYFIHISSSPYCSNLGYCSIVGRLFNFG